MLEISEVCVTVVCLQTNKQTTNKTKKKKKKLAAHGRETGRGALLFCSFLFCFVLQRRANYSCSARGEGGAEPH